MSIQPPCVKCDLRNNTNGLFTCNGCQQSFCSNHIEGHSSELRNRFDEIGNEYNTVKDIFGDYEKTTKDAQWKIRQREKTINEIKLQIDEHRKTANYAEKDLDKWMIQLKKLQAQLLKINEHNLFIRKIYFFINYLKWILNSEVFGTCPFYIFIFISTYVILPALALNRSSSNVLTFSKVDGPIQLLDHKHVALHNGSDSAHGSFRVNRIFSTGVHHVRLSFEKLSPSSNAFIGMIGENSKQSVSSSHGWFIGNTQLIPRQPGEYKIVQTLKWCWSFCFSNQSRRDVQQGDIIEVEIDCLNSKIELKNQHTKEKYELNIDKDLVPLPWQIMIDLDRHGDLVYLLQ